MLTAAILAQSPSQVKPDLITSLNWCSQIIIILDSIKLPSALPEFPVTVNWYAHPLRENFSIQRNFALQKAKNNWVLFIDTDESISNRLARQIQTAITHPEISGYYLNRQDLIWSKILHHGDTGRFKILRLGQKSHGIWVNKVHEIWNITGRTKVLSVPLIHRPFTDLADFLHKLNLYSDIRADELYHGGSPGKILDIILYPVGKFIYLWLFRLGIIDGIPGLIHAMSMAFYTFLVRSKLFTKTARL